MLVNSFHCKRRAPRGVPIQRGVDGECRVARQVRCGCFGAETQTGIKDLSGEGDAVRLHVEHVGLMACHQRGVDGLGFIMVVL